jgi:hypothetical protein
MYEIQSIDVKHVKKTIFPTGNEQSRAVGNLLLAFICSLMSFTTTAQVDHSLQDQFKKSLFCVHDAGKGVRFVFNEKSLDTLVNRVDSIAKLGSGNGYDFKSFDQDNRLRGEGWFHLHEPLGTRFEVGEGENLVRQPNYKTVVCVTSLRYFDQYNCLEVAWLKRCHYNWLIPSRSYWGANGCTYTYEEIRRMPGSR